MLLLFSVCLTLAKKTLEAFALLGRGIEHRLAEEVNVAGLRPGRFVNEVLDLLKEQISEVCEDLFLRRLFVAAAHLLAFLETKSLTLFS